MIPDQTSFTDETTSATALLFDNIRRLFTTPRGANIYCPFLGMRPAQEITDFLKNNKISLESELQQMFSLYEPRVEKVVFSEWHLPDNSGPLSCRVEMVHKDSGQRAAFRIRLGNNPRENMVQCT